MKSLYESIMDVDNNIDNFDQNPSILFHGLFQSHKECISTTIDNFKLSLDNANAKIHKTTNRIKNSDNFFIQITPNPGYTFDFMLFKRYGSNWYIFIIDMNDPKIYSLIVDSWQSLQPNLSPKNAYLYEVPEQMNNLCKDIFHQAKQYEYGG